MVWNGISYNRTWIDDTGCVRPVTKYEPYYANDEIVCLTDAEIEATARDGLGMRRTAVERGYEHSLGYNPTDEEAEYGHAVSALTESAIRRYMGFSLKIYTDVFNEPDMPGDIQARLISHEHYGLRVTQKDEDHWRVVGCVILPGWERKFYRLPGWFYVHEARQHTEWKMSPHKRPSMISVPQQCLRPMRELREIVRSEGWNYKPESQPLEPTGRSRPSSWDQAWQGGVR